MAPSRRLRLLTLVALPALLLIALVVPLTLVDVVVAAADDATAVCQPLSASAPPDPPAATADRHLLLVHVTPGESGRKQLAAYASVVGQVAEAGVPLDCWYREAPGGVDPLVPQLTPLPAAHLRLAGQLASWPLLELTGGSEVTADQLLARLTEQPAIVHSLDDSNFEAVTQAATGSTTGHWLVAFLDAADPDLASKGRLLAGLAQILRPGRISVARVLLGNKGQADAATTAARFGVSAAGNPEVVLLRAGSYYRLPHRLINWQLVSAFATRAYANERRYAVPPAPSPFDHAVDAALGFLLSFNSVYGVSPVYIALSAGAFVALAIIVGVCLCASKGLAKVTKTE